MRIAKGFVWLSPLLLAAGCHSTAPYTNSIQVISAADYTTPEVVMTNSAQPIIASENAVTVTPSEVHAPNPTATLATAKAPTQPLQPDGVLLSRVRQKLNEDADLAPVVAQIHIRSENGTVTLVGSVPDDEARQKIEAEVNQVQGVVSIDDQLEVPAGTPPPPGSTAESPVVSMSPTPSPTAAGEPTVVRVPPANSNPSLTPTSSEPGNNNRVYATRQSASAAATVQSSNFFNVHVEGPRGTEGTLAQRIIKELQADIALVPVLQTVNVAVADDQITLTGAVQDEQQKRRIQAAVQRATGINKVDNQLRVNNPPGSDNER